MLAARRLPGRTSGGPCAGRARLGLARRRRGRAFAAARGPGRASAAAAGVYIGESARHPAAGHPARRVHARRRAADAPHALRRQALRDRRQPGSRPARRHQRRVRRCSATSSSPGWRTASPASPSPPASAARSPAAPACSSSSTRSPRPSSAARSLAGGRGRILGALLGALLMGSLNNGMSLMNVPTFYQETARGVVLLVAVAIDQLEPAPGGVRSSMPTRTPASDRYDRMTYRRCGRTGLLLPGRLARRLGDLRRLPRRGRSPATACCAPSTWASPTSTSPTTTAPRRATPKRSAGAILARAAPRRADHLLEGRLPDVARAVRRMGLPQASWSPAATSRCAGSGSTTSTSSTRTAPTRRRRWRRRWRRWTTLVRQGKALYAGVSSYSGAQFAEAVRVCERERLRPDHHPPAVLQPARARHRDRPAARAARPAPASSRSARSPRAC